MDQAEQTAGRMVGQAKEQASSRLASQKDHVAGSAGAVAQAIRQTGRELRDQDQAAIGRYADTAADQVERFAGYLRDRDISDLVDDLEGFARRQPGLFLGGAVALGFLGTRFLMSSGRRAERRERALAGASSTAPGVGAYRPYDLEPFTATGDQSRTGAWGLGGRGPDLAGATGTGATGTGATGTGVASSASYGPAVTRPTAAPEAAGSPGATDRVEPTGSGASGSRDREAA
jgi:hypothetical protein